MDGASGLGRLPRWQLLGLVGGGKGLDWVEEGLGKRMGWYLVMVKVLRELAGKVERGELLLDN
ncbi:hypothetical protein Tco_0325607, partial [Tanacetum coccineum]